MAWSYNKKKTENAKDVWSIEEPNSKKRRVEDEEAQADDWGDLSLELTQADIESLDIVASQALGEHEIPTDCHTSVEEFAKPHNPPSFHRSSSSSSSDSSSRPKSNLSLSSNGSSSHSLSSHSSGSSKGELLLPKKGQDAHNRYQSDGELKFLRQALEKKEAEIEKLRAEKSAANEQWKQKQIEKEKKLKLQVDKLMSEAQFKEHEHQKTVQVLEKKLKDKEERLKATTTVESPVCSYSRELKISSPKKKPVKPSPPSKQRQQQRDEDGLTSSQLKDFPTQLSFLERPAGASPKAKTSPVVSETKSVSCQAVHTDGSKKIHPKKVKMRRLRLDKVSKDFDSGPNIVSSLIRPSSTASLEGEAGLCGLLQALSTSLTVNSLFYSRNKDNSFLSPIKPSRRSHGIGSDQTSSGDSGMVQVVCADNFHLAIQGLDMLLHSGRTGSLSGQTCYTFIRSHQSINPYGTNDNSHKNNAQDSLAVPIPTKPSSTDSSELKHHQSSASSLSLFLLSSKLFTLPQTLDEHHPHYGAVLILPVLYDYLQHYHHLVVTKSAIVKSPVNTPVSTRHPRYPCGGGSSSGLMDSVSVMTGSSSYDSSLDSLSSSVLHLLQEGKVYGMSMERYAISAIQCLCLLVQMCPVITSVLIDPSLEETEPSADSNVSIGGRRGQKAWVKGSKRSSQPEKSESGTDADDEKSTSSSEVRIITAFGKNSTIASSSTGKGPQSLNNQSQLLQCVARLASENLKETSISPTVVTESLCALSYLCQNCTSEQFKRLESVIINDALSSLLRQTKYPMVLVAAQRLCVQLLLHSGSGNKMCNKSETCLLFGMCRLCTDPAIDNLSPISTQLYSQHVTFLSSLTSHHRAGLGCLLVNACACSNEMISSTILAMYKLYNLFMKTRPDLSDTTPLLKTEPSTQDDKDTSSLFPVLLQGVLVLHCLAQADSSFLQRHGPVQLSYVRLLAGLSALIRPIRSSWEWHATVLDELCDFEPEFHDASSQDSEGDERMDQM